MSVLYYGALGLVLMALALGVSRLVAWPLASLWRRLAIVPRRQALLRRTPLLLLVPPFVGLLAAIGAVWPSHGWSLGAWSCHCAAGEFVHLCAAHPAYALPLLPLAVFLVAYLAWQPAGALYRVIADGWEERPLRRTLGRCPRDEHGVVLANLGTPNAFTLGLWRPLIIADRDWYLGLAPAERQIVAHHERSHVEARDPFALVWVRVFVAALPRAQQTAVVEAWLASVETRADAEAAAAVGDPLSVASFLLAEARRQPAQGALSLFGGCLAQRVAALAELPPPPRRPLPFSVVAPLALVVIAIALFAAGPLIHRSVETLVHLVA